jgi:hypothetical protein
VAAVDSIWPASIFSVVVSPAPFGPMTPNTSPEVPEKVLPRTATNLLYS